MTQEALGPLQALEAWCWVGVWLGRGRGLPTSVSREVRGQTCQRVLGQPVAAVGPGPAVLGAGETPAGLFSSESDVPRGERLSFSEMGAPETTRQSQPAGVII